MVVVHQIEEVSRDRMKDRPAPLSSRLALCTQLAGRAWLQAIDEHLNFFDTSPFYSILSKSEAVLGKGLKALPARA